MSHVLELSRTDTVRYAAQRSLAGAFAHTPLREDVPLREGSPDASVSEETMQFMGVQPMKILSSERAGLGMFPEQTAILESLVQNSH